MITVVTVLFSIYQYIEGINKLNRTVNNQKLFDDLKNAVEDPSKDIVSEFEGKLKELEEKLKDFEKENNLDCDKKTAIIKEYESFVDDEYRSFIANNKKIEERVSSLSNKIIKKQNETIESLKDEIGKNLAELKKLKKEYQTENQGQQDSSESSKGSEASS